MDPGRATLGPLNSREQGKMYGYLSDRKLKLLGKMWQ
jgi:hypothetical protein